MDTLEKVVRTIEVFARVQAPVLIKTEAVNFYQRSFRRKGFIDNSFQKWKENKSNTSTLVRAATLQNSIQAVVLNKRLIKVYSNVKYGKIHNEGGTINVPVTEKSKDFFWAKFFETGDPKWKYMAITNKSSLNIDMPQRQFIGDSRFLEKRIERVLERELERKLKSIL